VVEDFRYKLLINTSEIGPLIMQNNPAEFKYLNVRLSSVDRAGTIKKLKAAWQRRDPVHPFKYEFFDDQLTATHQAVFDIVSILGFIAFLAITIACLGMLGMATYTAERKRKEVGIRKVLGAEDFQIALMLSKEFLKVLFVAICIGVPMSYFVSNLWLQLLPNHVEFGFGTIFMASLVLLVLGLITIGSQTLRASRRNPVDSLKME
jgi:putative ABC transport system permease protein